MENRRITVPTVGEILKEEFMEPYGISAYRLANDIHVPVSRILSIIHNQRRITADTSIRLGTYFGISEDYFLKLQIDVDLRNEKEEIEDEINNIIPFRAREGLMQM